MKTVLFSLLAACASTFAYATSPLVIDTTKYPTIGDSKAPVQIVAFLEPKCPDSKRYNNTSFPRLQAEYIKTNKIRYTVVTTSFLQQSMPAAIALLCVYHQDANKPNTELFFKFLDYIYLNQPPERQNWATVETLLKFAAKASPDIDQDRLKKCIESGDYQAEIKNNTDYGNQLMGHLSTPTIYVNGLKVENRDDTIDYDKLKAAIDNALKM